MPEPSRSTEAQPSAEAIEERASYPWRLREGRCVCPTEEADIRPGDLVQHYSTWDQTYGDPMRREVVAVDDDGVTWRDPSGGDEYKTRRGSRPVDRIVGTPPLVLPPLDVCEVVAALVASLDAPSIHAAGVQEGRAAMLREVVEWFRDGVAMAVGCEDDVEAARLKRLADAIEARFPSEGTT